MTTINSHHGQPIEVIDGRTVLHYRDGFLQDGRICESAYDARKYAQRMKEGNRHFSTVNHEYVVK